MLITVGLKPADETDATLDADVRESRAITDLLSKIFLRFRSLSRPIKAHLAAYSVAAATRGAQGVGDVRFPFISSIAYLCLSFNLLQI